MLLVTLVVAETLFVKHYIEGAQDAAASGSGSPASTDEMDAPSAAHLAMERLDTAVTVCCAVVWVIPHLLLFLLPRSWVSACMQSNWESQLEFVNNLMNNTVEKPSGACARCAPTRRTRSPQRRRARLCARPSPLELHCTYRNCTVNVE